MTDLRLHPSAAEELEQAVAWYEQEQPGWGARFFAEARRRLAHAALLPTSGAGIQGVPPRCDARAFGLRRFPYRIVTVMVGAERFVIAVAHTSREPGYWLDRLG